MKNDSFKWIQATAQAFQQLKIAMTSALVLAIPNFNEIFILETDASGSGVGVVLSQNKHPIAYFSKSCLVECRNNLHILRNSMLLLKL